MALVPAVSTMSGAIFHPLAMVLLMSSWYFVFFLSLVSTSESKSRRRNEITTSNHNVFIFICSRPLSDE